MRKITSSRLIFATLTLLILGLLAAILVANLSEDRATQGLPSALIGKPVPQFSISWFPPFPTGGQAPLTNPGLTNDDLKSGIDLKTGRPILVNFFASWCIPCRVEHPLLMKLGKEEKIPIFGIAHRDKREDAIEFLANLGDPYSAIGLDQDGRVGIDWGVYGVPETYLIDGDGIVRWRWAGPLTPDIVDRELRPLIRQWSPR